MSIRGALAKLSVPTVPTTENSVGTAETQVPPCGSHGSHSSHGNGREPGTEPELSPAERCAWSRDLCRRLRADVTSRRPDGLERWGRAKDLVAAPTVRLLELLEVWETTGEPGDQRAASQAAAAVLHACEFAARRWCEEVAAFERFAIRHESDPEIPTPRCWEEL